MSLLQKSPTKKTYILQKRPIVFRSLLIDATPYRAVFNRDLGPLLLVNRALLGYRALLIEI